MGREMLPLEVHHVFHGKEVLWEKLADIYKSGLNSGSVHLLCYARYHNMYKINNNMVRLVYQLWKNYHAVSRHQNSKTNSEVDQRSYIRKLHL